MKLLKRLLRVMEPIRELEMLFAVVFERNLRFLAIPVQLQALEKPEDPDARAGQSSPGPRGWT